jgi:hypothetical protein
MTPAGFEQLLLTVGQPAGPGEQAPPFGAEELARTVALAPEYGLELRLPGDGQPAAAG